MNIPKEALQVFAASLIANYKMNDRFREIVDMAFEKVREHAEEQDEIETMLYPFFEGIAEGFIDCWKGHGEEG